MAYTGNPEDNPDPFQQGTSTGGRDAMAPDRTRQDFADSIRNGGRFVGQGEYLQGWNAFAQRLWQQAGGDRSRFEALFNADPSAQHFNVDYDGGVPRVTQKSDKLNTAAMLLAGGGLGVGLGSLAAGALAGGAAPTVAGTGELASTALPTLGVPTAAASGVATAGAAGAAGASMASSMPWWLPPALQVGGGIATRAMSNGGTQKTQTGLPPEIEQQLFRTLQLQNDRQQRQVPIHEAAMRLASSMAPGTSSAGPRLAQSNQAAQAPKSAAPMDPGFLDAIRLLMGAH